MKIDKATVAYIASLSKLKVAEDEIDSICSELSTMLDYVDEINLSVKTGYVAYRVENNTNATRQDDVSVSMDRAELLSNVPQHTNETPIVPITVR